MTKLADYAGMLILLALSACGGGSASQSFAVPQVGAAPIPVVIAAPAPAPASVPVSDPAPAMIAVPAIPAASTLTQSAPSSTAAIVAQAEQMSRNWRIVLQRFRQQNGGKAWSFSTADGIDRFELRSGDKWSGDGDAHKERSEVYSPEKMLIGETYAFSFSVMVEPGARNSAEWLSLMQLQSTFDPGEDGHSPPFALEMVGERMRIVTRDSAPQLSTLADTRYVRHYTDSVDIVRGKWYDFNIAIQFGPFGNGSLTVVRDGVSLVNYKGALGFNDLIGTYLKEGLYRAPSPETFAAQYKNMTVGIMEH